MKLEHGSLPLPPGERFLELSPDAYCILDLHTARLKWLNPACARMLKSSLQDLVGVVFYDLLHPDDQAEVRERGLSGSSLSMRCRCQDGSYRTVMWDVSPDPTAGLTYAIGRDVTEVLALEEQLNQAQKMDAIGRVAGGIAHGFNNILSVILGLGELVKDELHPDHSVQADLDEILTAGGRARGLTQQLLAFSRRQLLCPQVVDINLALRHQERMLRQLLGETIVLKLELTPDLPPMLVDPGQLHLVIMSLAVNARDAMPNGGLFTLETSLAGVEELLVSGYFGATCEGLVRLAVRDNGVGMSAQVRARIFEPFFTTKGPDQGTGLGLATVFGIVKQSRGHIRLESQPGQGTCFTLYFPIAPTPAAIPTPVSNLPTDVTQTILLAEDEPMLRRLARIGLERAGYRVLQASNGEEAVKIASQFEEPIHLMVTDVLMPHLNGPQAVEQIRADRPDMKILYISGYSDEAFIQHDSTPINLLGKPFQPRELVARVRQILGC